jgi:PKD repeat protein
MLMAITAKAQMPVAAFQAQGNTTGCAPLTVQFVNQSQNAVSFFWDFGNGNTSTMMNPVTVYLQPGTYTVKLVVTSISGQSDSLIRNNYISTGVVPSVSFTASPLTICEGEIVTFQNQTQNFTSCLWDFGDGNTSTDVSPSHQYTLAGQFTVTLVATHTAGGCSHSLTKTQYITVHPKPVTTFTASPVTGCFSNQPVSFQSVSSYSVSYQWLFGDGQSSTLQNPSHVYNNSGPFTVTLITTSAFGCKDTLVKNNYIHFLDNPVPVINASATGGCTPKNIGFSTNAQNVTSYLWNFGNNQYSNLPNPNFYYTTGGTYTTSVTVTYQNGCSNTSQPFTVTMLQTPNVYYYFTPANSGCSPLNIQFHCSTPATGNTFNWNFGDGTTSSLPNPNHIYTLPGVYSTSLTVTNVNGCTGSYAYTMPVVVNNPDASFHTDVISGCPPLQVSFYSHAGSGAASYLWNFGDGTTSTQAHPVHLYQSAGTYSPTLTVTDASGCTATYTLPTPITAAQSATNFITPPPVTACAPFTVSFSDNSFGAVSWNWNFGDGNSSTQQNPTHTYQTPGTYTVSLTTLTNGTGCGQNIPVYRVFNIIGGKADFSFLTEKCPPYVAYFQDSSINAVAWLWDFGDGTTSTQQHPVHTYANPGSYTVSLTITTADGCTYTSTHNYAVNFEPLSASPIATTTDTIPPLNVQFYANSQGATGWLWNFGDGGTSTQQNPVHTFNTAPPYNITLTLFNDSCSYLITFPNVTLGAGNVNLGNDSTVVHQPEPQSGCAPLTFHFYCPILNTVSWQWFFGDGGTSNLKNPVHTYTQPGLYDVMLVTTNTSGITDTLFRPQSVLVKGTQAGFNIIPSGSCSGNTIQLQNTSVNASVFNWDFGDGSTSTLSNPTHTYTNTANNYVVSLIVSDTSGCSSFAQKTFYGVPGNAILSDKRKICAGDTVHFSSVNLNYASFVWNFGNGVTSTLPNPSCVFQDSGVYNVTLIVSDSSGCQQTFNLPYPIEVIKPVARFITGNINPNCWNITYQFINQSTGATSYLWNYGNGNFSTGINGSQVYGIQNPGYYTVTLTAFKDNCTSTYSITDSVYIPYRDADFSFSKNTNCIPATVTFSDSSRDAVSWFWDFGDGNFSTQQNPVHVYQTAPVRNVKLTITDMYGCTDTISKPVIDAAYAGFTIPQVSGCAPVTVAFSDSSGHAIAWNWDFGNGQTSNQQNPQVTYTQNGYYSVQLTITSTYGCTSTYQLDSAVYVSGPEAAFTTSFTSGCAPALVDFINQSTNATSWLWNFGDNSFSNAENPSHVYHTPGQFTVSLVSMDDNGCTDTAVWNSEIIIRGPVAAFTIPASEGCVPFEVQFSNQTINGTSFFWNFGDGDTSALFNPVHQYLSPGNYIVSLIVSDSTGCESVYIYPDTIKVYEKPQVTAIANLLSGCTPLQVSFNAAGNFSSGLMWNFGDGSFSSLSAPVHTYNDSGLYQVTLIAYSGSVCNDTSFLTVQAVASPQADFQADLTSGCAPLTVNFINQSTGTSGAAYLWTFSNGQTSQLQNPSVTFTQPGLYSVSLVVSNQGICSDSVEKTAYITVYDTLPPSQAQILAASVVNDHKVKITWLNVADPDIWAYHLFRQDNQTGLWNQVYSVIDTNANSLNVVNSYIDVVPNTLVETYSYRIQTEDRCGNRMSLELSDIHTTINISSEERQDGIYVSWTPYQGCFFNEYELFRKESGANQWNLIAILPSSMTEYYDSSGLCPGIYQYRVKAKDLCGSGYVANSDTSATGSTALTAQSVDIVFATVIDDEFVRIEWDPPAAYPDRVIAYQLYRSDDKVNYHLISTLNPDELRYDDHQADVHKQNYYYMIIPLNNCNIAPDTGYIGSSILLTAETDETTETVKLKWTPYTQWENGVKEYIIQRKEGNHPWETIRTVGGNKTETED